MTGVKAALSKVPEVTLGFWIIKILATTLGETGGDAVTMSLLHADKDAHNGGYLIGAGVFMALFVAAVIVQIATKSFRPAVYWLTIVATTTVGTAMADFADRSLGVGYMGGSLILFALLMASLIAWRWREGTVSVNSVRTPRAEMFYWATILFSQTLGTALGDWMADTNGFGYENAALVFGAALAILAAAYFFTSAISRVSVLGRLHPHPPARRDAWRLVRQADRPGRVRGRPFHGDRHPRRGDGRPHPPRTATAGRSPGLGLRGAGGVEANAR